MKSRINQFKKQLSFRAKTKLDLKKSLNDGKLGEIKSLDNTSCLMTPTPNYCFKKIITHFSPVFSWTSLFTYFMINKLTLQKYAESVRI